MSMRGQHSNGGEADRFKDVIDSLYAVGKPFVTCWKLASGLTKSSHHACVFPINPEVSPRPLTKQALMPLSRVAIASAS